MGEPQLGENEYGLLAWNDEDDWIAACCSAIPFSENEIILSIPVELGNEPDLENFMIQTNADDLEEYSFDFSTVDGDINDIVFTNELFGNYPNPFNPKTTLSFSVSSDNTPVKIEIFNIKGQLVETLVNENYDTGNYQFVWNADKQASGVYFYRCNIADYSSIKKMLLIK